MLRTLRIREFVIIEDLTLEFGPGLTLLTGETGAGKSILVDALNLVAGQRAPRQMIRAGAERAVIEAEFELAEGAPARAWAAEHGADEVVEEGRAVIRRELSRDGSGRVRLNGSPISLGALRELGALLVELHGQHEQQSLLGPERHLELVDRSGGHSAEAERVEQAYRELDRAVAQRDSLRRAAAEREGRRQALEALARQIEAVSPEPGELDRLDAERSRLQNASRIGELVEQVIELTYDGEPSASALAALAARRAGELADLDATVRDAAERLAVALVELQEGGAAFRDYRDRTDFDPARLDTVEERRAAIRELCLRHGPDEVAVVEAGRRARAEISALDELERDLDAADGKVASAEAAYAKAAGRLGRAREAAAKRLVPEMRRQLEALALKKARFDVRLSAFDRPSARGAERAEFLLSANPGEPLRELRQIASGGELSRVMLALHAVCEDAANGRALVFDEVDSGVGGAVADAVGARLAALARRNQVLCVTHLPQVAAYADRHYTVRKRQAGQRTLAEAIELSDGDRVEELARMLAGKRPTEASRRHAGELLEAAARPGARRRA